MAAMISQPLRAKNGSLCTGEALLPILLAQAIAARPQTALPRVNSVGIIAIFFTAATVCSGSKHPEGQRCCKDTGLRGCLPDLPGGDDFCWDTHCEVQRQATARSWGLLPRQNFQLWTGLVSCALRFAVISNTL